MFKLKTENILDEIDNYIFTKKAVLPTDKVAVGRAFTECMLKELFDLSEEEAIESTEISGAYDNGLDAVFEYDDDLYVVQAKYKNANNIDSMSRFRDDCECLLTDLPVTSREIVKQKCALIRKYYQDGKAIHCYYITNDAFNTHLTHRATELQQVSKYRPMEFHYFDIYKINDRLEDNLSSLPREIRNKRFNVLFNKHFECGSNSIICAISLQELAKLVKNAGDLIFEYNLRKHLRKTKINQGIEKTLKEKPDHFWFFNNGITIWCSEMKHEGGEVYSLKAPQIVNGCQTARTVANYLSTLSPQEQVGVEGLVLVKIIRAQNSLSDEEKKELRQNITKFTNSQNSIRGLDFYALDQMQRSIQRDLAKLGYFYEIQRGSYWSEKVKDPSFAKRLKGTPSLAYLVADNYDYVIPAKDAMQAFASGMRGMTDVAYSSASQLTPLGTKWDQLCNDKTKQLPPEFFLYPYLVLKYAKAHLKYGAQSGFRTYASLFFVGVYFDFLMRLLNHFQKKQYSQPTDIELKLFKAIFESPELNKYLLQKTDDLLKSFFGETRMIEEISRSSYNNFFKTKELSKTSIAQKYMFMFEEEIDPQKIEQIFKDSDLGLKIC